MSDPRGWIDRAQARCDATLKLPLVSSSAAHAITAGRRDQRLALAALTAVLDRADQWDEEFPEARTQFAEAVRQCLTNIRGTVAAALAGEA